MSHTIASLNSLNESLPYFDLDIFDIWLDVGCRRGCSSSNQEKQKFYQKSFPFVFVTASFLLKLNIHLSDETFLSDFQTL